MQPELLFHPGNVLYIKDYLFENNSTRNKYLVVLASNNEEQKFIYSLTTSQQKVPDEKLFHGCNTLEHFPFYVFQEERIVGANNFSFEKKTFIYYQGNVRESPFSHFSGSHIKKDDDMVKDMLTGEEFLRVLKCALKSPFIPRKFRNDIEKNRDLMAKK